MGIHNFEQPSAACDFPHVALKFSFRSLSRRCPNRGLCRRKCAPISCRHTSNVAMWLNVFMTRREYAIYCTYAEPRLTCAIFPSNQILYRWRLPANWAAAWQDMPDSSLTSSTDEQTGRWNTCRSHPRTFLRQNTMGYLLDAGSLSLQIAEKKNSGPFWSSESFPTTGSDWPFLPLSGGA